MLILDERHKQEAAAVPRGIPPVFALAVLNPDDIAVGHIVHHNFTIMREIRAGRTYAVALTEYPVGTGKYTI